MAATRPAAAARRRLAQLVPKTELHLHLDGSLTPEWIVAAAARHGIPLRDRMAELGVVPPVGREADFVRRYLHTMKAASKTTKVAAGANWPHFDFCNALLQTHTDLASATDDLFTRLHRDHNVRYAEVRFCPLLHGDKGLTPRDSVAAVVEGMRAACGRTGVVGGVILCCLRSRPVAEAVDMVRLAAELMGGGGVVGFDVAGDEGAFPLDSMQAALDEAHALGVPVTVHAGEWPDTAPNVLLALKAPAVRRIGHATVLAHHHDLVAAVAASGRAVEVCLTGNVAYGRVVSEWAAHPLAALHRAGTKVNLSSDNLLLSGSADTAASPTNEVLRAFEAGLSAEEVRAVLRQGPRCALPNPAVTDVWLAEFDAALDAAFDAAGAVDAG